MLSSKPYIEGQHSADHVVFEGAGWAEETPFFDCVLHLRPFRLGCCTSLLVLSGGVRR